MFPPVYEEGAFSTSGHILPPYSPRERPDGGSKRTEHVFSLKDQKKKIRATLKLLSSAPTPASLPTFLAGDKINGSLTLHIPRSEKISEVSVLVRGEIVTGSQKQDRLCFLNIQIPLWSKGGGGTSAALSGDCHWPFSLDIPKDVALEDYARPGNFRTYALPQTFLERHSNASAHYHLSVQIIRSSLLLHTMFVYVPAVRPDPPSILRQVAYRNNISIPGPEIDRDGWHTCPTVNSKGTIFNIRKVEVQCSLSLAKPLAYTRGSVIPCSLTIFCQDQQVLNLLGSPSTLNVRLCRQVKCKSTSPAARTSNPLRFTADDVEESGRAIWWPKDDETGHPESRRFEGEIKLAKNLKPTSAISHFSLTYFVVMLPFEVTGFLPVNTQPLIQQEVQIATIFAKGPRPRHYAPDSGTC
ncbi:hypothetical protein B0H15DRAFT_896895 [Mycena belliarum]|uniref:Arrestin-like N-terminal domain-containing protein n=1 Tax=Mycena belliarum TaxID=1033014 RepID=A0AAD6UQV0_9AGAR|nr:hypothetical protein B0H15DRAFT_896895 [Mycena belliae]